MNYEITLLLSTDAPLPEAEDFAVELVADAHAHLRPGERLELERVAARNTPQT